jgi:hypothetical protein
LVSATAILKANRSGLVSAGLRKPLTKAEMTKAEMNGAQRPGAAQGMALPQQWIVLTTWEQVETPAAGSDSVTDFGANANSDAAAAAQPGKSGTRQITVTQLILRVYPASAASAPDRHSQAAGESSARPLKDFNSVLHRQAVLPLSSGWLVIQL